jgi:oligopeptidase B
VQVLLDENELLAGHAGAGGYLALGVREVSPDGRLLAYSADFTGDEVYQLRVRDLGTGADLPERIGRTYYGLAWSAGSDQFWYVVTDPQYRPHEVWRHRLGTGPETDELVYREDDERFEVTVRVSRSGTWTLIETASRDTSETLAVPAGNPGAAPVVLLPRKKGVEYQAEHAAGPDGGEFLLVTNDGAAEFRLVAMPAGATGRKRWTEVIAGDPATRLVHCDAFGDYLVVEQRRDAATQLRLIDRRSGEQRLIEAAGPHISLALAVNEEYQVPAVTVRTESLIDPPAWHDVELASGQWRLRKRQQVPGYDPGRYLTRRVTARAGDGTLIPVTLACQAGLRPDGTAPCLLYGYGAYESCEWPEFGAGIPSLLDRVSCTRWPTCAAAARAAGGGGRLGG